MLINGKKVEGPNVAVCVIPRGTGDLIFKARAVLDYSDFDKICPRPTPPEIIRPGEGKSQNTEDPDYKKLVTDWAIKKNTWMFLKSLEATDGLVWDSVSMSDPSTWDNYESDLLSAGLTDYEISRILLAVLDACGLNQDKIDEATKSFLAGEAAKLTE